MRPARRGGNRDLPAAWAGQRRQQPLTHQLADPHVPDLRPRRARRPGTVQADPAPRALRRRISALALIRVRVAPQAAARMAGLPAPLAVLAPLPLRLLAVPAPGLAALPRPDGLPRRRRPRVGAVHPQPPLQPGDLQLQPLPQLPLSRQLGPQHGVLGVLRLHRRPQPGQQLTLLLVAARRIGLTGHKPQACSTRTTTSSSRDPARRDCQFRPHHGTPGSRPRRVAAHAARTPVPAPHLDLLFAANGRGRCAGHSSTPIFNSAACHRAGVSQS
jgi:hypothetical protein